MDIWIIKETCLDGDYERNETIQNGWTIIDLGAYLGGFSVSIARKHKDCIVYAYEPSSHSFALLQENTNLNKTHNVKTFPYAVGSTSGLSSLYIASETAVKHSTAKASDEKEQKKIEVKVVTLDQIFEELQIHRCDFLKIDCEGAEYDILFRTCAETLHKIRYISMEYHNNVTSFSHEDLVVYLQNKGFAVKTYPNLAHPRDLGFLYAKNAHWT